MSKVIETTKADFAENFLFLNGHQLSLDDYPHLRAIYNSDAPEAVFMFSRQCVYNNQEIFLSDGSKKLAKDLNEGDSILGFNSDTLKIELDTIANIWDNGIKPVYKINTRTGREIYITNNHPIWKIDGWYKAEDLKKGDLIGVSRNNSISNYNKKVVRDCEYKILAFLLSEGSLTRSLGFTNTSSINVQEFKLALKDFNERLELKALPSKYPGQFRIKGNPNTLRTYLLDLELLNKNSVTKFHPELIFKLTEKQIKDYLRIWWNTDGFWSINKKGIAYAGISLISKDLIKGIQTLLLKLGIHSTIHEQIPKVYENTDKIVYRLYIEGQDSIIKFYNKIKTFKRPEILNIKRENNNRLVYDKSYLDNYLDKKDIRTSSINYGIKRLKDLKDKYSIIKKLVEADIFFDKIINIEYIAELPTVGIETRTTNTFLIDNIVTHNTAKSTTLANLMITNSVMNNYFKSLYIAPTVDQTKVFSHDRINPVLDGSPLIKEHYMNSSLIQNVFMKQLLNGSRMYLRYALLSADRIRGYSADMNIFDEVQDLREEIIPVVQETMTRSMFKWSLYAGTPKRSKGTLATIWDRSTRNEYIIKCQGCNSWNILGPDNIGEHGVVCNKCGRSMDVKQGGQWVSTYSLTQAPRLEGFRVCLLHFDRAPWVNWEKDVLGKREKYSTSRFHNEVLALEYDEGTSPITEADLIRSCREDYVMTGYPNELDISYKSIMGIDYGPINSENSHTVITIMQKRGDRYHILYMKKFLGKEADYSYIHRVIPELMERWKVVHLAADYGMGEAPNSEIRNKLGYNRVIAFQHLPTQKEKIRWNPKMPAYTLSRNQIMNEFFQSIRNNKIVFPRWEDVEPFKDDFLNVQMDFDEEKNSMKFTSIGPDDATHSTLYAQVALDLLHGVANFS